MSEIFSGTIVTPYFNLKATIKDDKLTGLSFDYCESADENPPPLFYRLEEEIREYLNGSRKYFDIPLDPEVTPFRKKCLDAMLEIGYGETISYAELAKAASNPKAVRAAATACATNPIAIIIPCHRVIRSDGSFGNYGAGKELKAWLIRHERENLE